MENRLGNLEEMVLLMLILVKEEAYGVSVREAYLKHLNQDISLSAIHTVLRRLEKKGFITSEMGGSTQDRGGRRKRLYTVTKHGLRTLATLQAERDRIWGLLPKLDI
ncbi:MAG: PadR family transcriptional regulator [Bacteroidota bacterium]